jgi:hypothetical protein
VNDIFCFPQYFRMKTPFHLVKGRNILILTTQIFKGKKQGGCETSGINTFNLEFTSRASQIRDACQNVFNKICVVMEMNFVPNFWNTFFWK